MLLAGINIFPGVVVTIGALYGRLVERYASRLTPFG